MHSVTSMHLYLPAEPADLVTDLCRHPLFIPGHAAQSPVCKASSPLKIHIPLNLQTTVQILPDPKHFSWCGPLPWRTPLHWLLPTGLADAPVEWKVHRSGDPDLLGSLIRPNPWTGLAGWKHLINICSQDSDLPIS